MKITIESTPKEMAELLSEIKTQPDKVLDVDKTIKRMYHALSTIIFSSTLNKNF